VLTVGALVCGECPAFLLADLVVADGRPVLLVDEVELEIVLVDRALHLHGRVDEPEGDASRPDRAGHVRRYPRTAVGETSCSREERRTDPSPPQGRGTEDATPARQESLRRLSVHPFRETRSFLAAFRRARRSHE